nr:hypothetical protein [Acidiferrobacterales bacterium]
MSGLATHSRLQGTPQNNSNQAQIDTSRKRPRENTAGKLNESANRQSIDSGAEERTFGIKRRKTKFDSA